MTERKKPLDEIVLADSSKGFNQSDKLSERVNRYSIAKLRSSQNCSFVLALSKTVDSSYKQRLYSDLSAKLSGCGNYLVFNNYYTKGITRLSKASFCKNHLMCPLCAIRRGSKSLQGYVAKYDKIMEENPSLSLSMITYTVKNGNDLSERFSHIKTSIRKLFSRRRDHLNKNRKYVEFSKVEGAVGTYEVTNTGNGWHPHAHIMVLHYGTFDYQKLKDEWKSITGDSHVVNVTGSKHPGEPSKDFIEVFKYAVKFSGLSLENNLHAWEVMKGSRLLFSMGLFFGVKIPNNLTDDVLQDLPYVELFYKFFSSGYFLSTAKHVSVEDIPLDIKVSVNKPIKAKNKIRFNAGKIARPILDELLRIPKLPINQKGKIVKYLSLSENNQILSWVGSGRAPLWIIDFKKSGGDLKDILIEQINP